MWALWCWEIFNFPWQLDAYESSQITTCWFIKHFNWFMIHFFLLLIYTSQTLIFIPQKTIHDWDDFNDTFNNSFQLVVFIWIYKYCAVFVKAFKNDYDDCDDDKWCIYKCMWNLFSYWRSVNIWQWDYLVVIKSVVDVRRKMWKIREFLLEMEFFEILYFEKKMS